MLKPKGLDNSPIYDDQGRMVGYGNTMFPMPADHTALALSALMAQRSYLKPVPNIQTNNMDEAYNRSLFVKPNYVTATPMYEDQIKRNKQLQNILFMLFGGKK